MENLSLLEYWKWADAQILAILKELTTEIVENTPKEGSVSISDRILHLAEEYTAWLHDIQQTSWKEDIEALQDHPATVLYRSIESLHTKWHAYVTSPPTTSYSIDEGDGLVVPVSLDEVVFNLVNHATYHRGQIVGLLRMAGIDVPITDWYWYKISKLNS